MGQITGSFIPFIDARDLIANIKHTEFKAAIFNIIGLGLDMFTGPGGSAFDVSKAFSKLGRYVTKYSDDAPKVVQAITKSAEYFPEAEKVVPDLVKVLPAGALDDLADSVKNGSKLTKKEYEVFEQVCENSGKNISKATKFAVRNQELSSELAKISESALEEMIDIVGEKTARKFVKHSNHFARGKKAENGIKKLNGKIKGYNYEVKIIDKTGGAYRLLGNQTKDGSFFWEVFERTHK